MRRIGVVAWPIFFAGALPLAAQSSPPQLGIPWMMRGPEVYGREPSQVRWTPDGKWIYFEWLPAGTDYREPLHHYRVRAEPGAVPELVNDAAMDSIAPLVTPGPTMNSGRVVESGGDIYVVSLTQPPYRALRITETVAAETNPHNTLQGGVTFTRDGNAYYVGTGAGSTILQLTDIRLADAAAAATLAGGRGGGGGRGGRGAAEPPTGRGATTNAERAALEADQKQLFEVIRDQAHADSARRAEAALHGRILPKTVTLLPNERVGTIQVSPNLGAILFTTTTPGDARATQVPTYVTSTGFTEEIAGRTKVGDAQNRNRLGYQKPGADVKWLRPMEADSLANVNIIGWADGGGSALIVATSRDFKTRQLSIVDGLTGTMKPIDVLHDTAWVGGPCGFGCAGFYENGARVYFVSEATGWAQLHTVGVDGSNHRELTTGKFEIYDVALSRDARSFLIHSSEVSPFDRDLWRVPVNGGQRYRLTTGAGGHQAVLSPDESMMADVYSTTNRPPELYLSAPCGPNSCPAMPPARLTTSPSAEWLAFKWVNPEIVMVPASDGAQVPSHIYRPKDFGAKPNGAAVIFVHGAGYMHNVHHYWKSSYPREYMFNQFLASKGYVVLDMDYRASAGYGRDWRTAIYRWMGGRDLQDEVDGSKYLSKNYGVHPERVGIYGGSYGGFMTLMALFTAPRYFGAGAALRPVTDWAHYNNGYTGQILNLPQNDTLAYHRSSPIFFAEGLEDPLLILHGMVDTNVNFQDSVLLTERLIELGKTGWSITPYPVEDHGFVRPASWTDEYRRIFDLFEGTIGPKGSKARQ